MSVIEIKVPDIGDFTDIPVIEVLVKAGDTVKAEDSLVTLESDKATMDVPSPVGGVVKDVRVKVGDKVSQGTVVLTLEAADAQRPRRARHPPLRPRPRRPRRPRQPYPRLRRPKRHRRARPRPRRLRPPSTARRSRPRTHRRRCARSRASSASIFRA